MPANIRKNQPYKIKLVFCGMKLLCHSVFVRLPLMVPSIAMVPV